MKGNRNKARGREYEHWVKRRFESKGYRVMRAGASLGEFDLIAIGPDAAYCVQVKGGKHPYCSPKERHAISAFPVPPYVFKKEIWFVKANGAGYPLEVTRLSMPEGRLIHGSSDL